MNTIDLIVMFLEGLFYVISFIFIPLFFRFVYKKYKYSFIIALLNSVIIFSLHNINAVLMLLKYKTFDVTVSWIHVLSYFFVGWFILSFKYKRIK